jgi:hypothetical protein
MEAGQKGILFMKWPSILALMFFLTWIVYAADLTGTWKGNLETAMGPIASTIILQTVDAKLTGSVKTELYEAKIENMELNGNKLFFVTNTDFGKLYYEGVVTVEEMKLHVTGQDGNPLPLNVRKQK